MCDGTEWASCTNVGPPPLYIQYNKWAEPGNEAKIEHGMHCAYPLWIMTPPHTQSDTLLSWIIYNP